MSVITARPEGPSRYVDDALLIALAQNGALRLNCESALVSLIYDGTPRITAEAGQSTSLCGPYDRSSSLHQTSQQDFLDRIQSLAFFRGDRSVEQSDNVIADDTRHIVHDLSLLSSHRQQVASDLKTTQVSYAAVPIRSVSGQILGILSVVDSKLRDDFLSHEAYSTLLDIALATSRHLESQHVQVGKDHDTQANLHLSKFLEHNRPQPLTRASLAKSRHMSNTSVRPSRDGTSDDTLFDEAVSSACSTPLTTPPEECPEFCFDKKSLQSQDTSTSTDGRSPHRALSAAATLIREAHNLEGLVLLDATPSIRNSAPWPDHDLNTERASLCEQLEVSISNEGQTQARITSPISLQHASVDYLILYFPQGCVLKVGDSGVLSLVIVDTSMSGRSGPALYQKLDKAIVLPADLDLLLHQGQSLIFMPLWDAARQAFYAGMLGWAEDSTREFTEHDLLSLSIYGRILTAEISRLDAIDTEATKSDFVSSLSHELRSPLHGCLAAVEILRDTTLDQAQTDLVEMIESCSSTLLYTMNHLLDFSSINDLDRMPSKTRRMSHEETSPDLRPNLFGRTVEDYLCRLVQEVVEGVAFGHAKEQSAHESEFSSAPQYYTMRFDSDTSTARSTDVAVFLEMDCHAAWYSTFSAGAWKRLVMNLFGNALKFCQRGHIEITLRMMADPHDPEKKMAHFMISDTGIGMSEKFLKHSLYRPFVQANPLISGNGLGLSIVKQIVNDMHGTISVKSSVGAGTRFDVFIPLVQRKARHEEVIPGGGEILDPQARLHGRTLCLLSSPHTPSESTNASIQRTKVLHSYVKSIVEGWFHMKVVTAEMAANVDADIYVAESSDYGVYACSANGSASSLNRHGTVLVGSPRDIRQARNRCPHDFVELNYPLGPQTLSRALHAALGMQASQTATVGLPKQMEKTDIDPVIHKPEHASSEPSIPADPINTTHQTEHLLLVDDNAINLRLLSTFIKRLSLPAHTAVDGQDAFDIYRAFATTNPFTTILMDISMPKMSGFESSRAIRDFEVENNLPSARIIALTALGSEASRLEAEASGIDDFQMKPVALKTLKSLFQSAS